MIMTKWCGVVGFTDTVETEPGLWELRVELRLYYGDLIYDRWKRENSGGINDNIDLSHQVSIVADPYAIDHCSSIVFVECMGEKGKVTNVEVQYPRLILSIGGVWNGK